MSYRPLSWEQFADTGLFWLMNQFLHTFGMVIIREVDEKGKVVNVFPARTSFRGFCKEDSDEGFVMVSQYMKDNADELYNEITGEPDQ